MQIGLGMVQVVSGEKEVSESPLTDLFQSALV